MRGFAAETAVDICRCRRGICRRGNGRRDERFSPRGARLLSASQPGDAPRGARAFRAGDFARARRSAWPLCAGKADRPRRRNPYQCQGRQHVRAGGVRERRDPHHQSDARVDSRDLSEPVALDLAVPHEQRSSGGQ